LLRIGQPGTQCTSVVQNVWWQNLALFHKS
jgi:hypothetical protein